MIILKLTKRYAEETQKLSEHLVRKRKPEVVQKAKLKFIEKNGKLFCEVCGFDFFAVYGDRGSGFIEGHHTVMVSDEKRFGTKVEDIALICSNCHSMIHKEPLLSIVELQKIVKEIKHQ